MGINIPTSSSSAGSKRLLCETTLRIFGRLTFAKRYAKRPQESCRAVCKQLRKRRPPESEGKAVLYPLEILSVVDIPHHKHICWSMSKQILKPYGLSDDQTLHSFYPRQHKRAAHTRFFCAKIQKIKFQDEDLVSFRCILSYTSWTIEC